MSIHTVPEFGQPTPWQRQALATLNRTAELANELPPTIAELVHERIATYRSSLGYLTGPPITPAYRTQRALIGELLGDVEQLHRLITA